MKLYIKAVPIDYHKRQEQLLKASGIKPDSRKVPQGFSAIVGFDFGDIYVDDSIDAKLADDLRAEIDDCLVRFIKSDYGNITEDERDNNIENFWFGCGKGLTARYTLSIGEIEMYLGMEGTSIKLL